MNSARTHTYELNSIEIEYKRYIETFLWLFHAQRTPKKSALVILHFYFYPTLVLYEYTHIYISGIRRVLFYLIFKTPPSSLYVVAVAFNSSFLSRLLLASPQWWAPPISNFEMASAPACSHLLVPVFLWEGAHKK